MCECFSLDRLLSYQINSTDHMEAGGKCRVPKGRNSGKSSNVASSYEFIIICHRRNLTAGFNRICNDTAGLLKSVLIGLVLLFFYFDLLQSIKFS